jgi:hypothetical protein
MGWIVPVLEWGPGKSRIVMVSAHDEAIDPSIGEGVLTDLVGGRIANVADPSIILKPGAVLTQFVFRPLTKGEYDELNIRCGREDDPAVAGAMMGLRCFNLCIVAVQLSEDERIDDRRVIDNSVPTSVKTELGSRLYRLCCQVPDPLSGR